MTRLTLSFLGGYDVRLDGVAVTGFRSAKVRALLAYLAVEGDRAHSRSRLAGLLWPDYDESASLAYLRRALHNLRDILADRDLPAPVLMLRGDSIQFDPSCGCSCDVADLQVAARATRDRTWEADAMGRLARAAERYRGSFLEGFHLDDSDLFEEWSLLTRERLHVLELEALSRLADYHAAQGSQAQAIAYARRLVELEPEREESRRQLMWLLAQDGRRSEALEQYESMREMLQRSMQAEPDGATLALVQQIRRGGPARPDAAKDIVPPVGAPPALRHNLPAQLTPFVGREAQLTELAARIGTSRLLTLTGAGGVGKTRLALEVARGVLDQFADGAWFVDLAPITEPDLVPATVADVFRLPVQPGSTVEEALTTYLETKRLLLLLDNCEHLLDACARLAERILRACPSVHLLATGREALRIGGETAWRVASLTRPMDQADGKRLKVADLEQYEAVRLFVQRAAMVRPDFVLTADNAPAVAQICARLDGIPLAIELAAARMRALTPEQIAARLDDRFRWLTAGSRTAPQRQQTLEAAVDWSYRLLSAQEQALFRRLSVFARGWTLEAAEAIGSGNGIEPAEVLDLLARLVDKSLVVADEAGPEPRYRMLETILAFARARLAESAEGDAVARSHLAYFRGLAEEAAPALEGWGQQEWLERLEADHDNFRRALAWGLEHAEEDALRAAATLRYFWWMRGHFVEGRSWIERALAVADRTSCSGATLAGLLSAAAWFPALQGELDVAVAFATRGLAVAEETGDLRNAGRSLIWLASAATFRKQFTEGEAQLQWALELGRQAADDWLCSLALFHLGLNQMHQGRQDRARPLLEEALRISRAAGDEWISGWPGLTLAEVALLEGNRDRALELIRDGLASAHRLGQRHLAAWLLFLRGEVHRLDGALEPALETFREALALARELDAKDHIQSTLDGIARVYAGQEKSQEAAWLLGAAEALRDRLGFPLNPADLPRHEQTVDMLRARLGDERMAAEWARGRAMPLVEAIALAMSG